MMKDILDALHLVMTGAPRPTAEKTAAFPVVGAWGIGLLEGVFIVLGSDRLKDGIPEQYFPILAFDDGNQSVYGTTGQYGVQFTTSVIVPQNNGAIFGWEERKKYKKGILDIVDAIVGTVRKNEYLKNNKGELVTAGLTGKIDIRRDSRLDSTGAFITNQIATIMVAYKAFRKEGE